MRKKQTTRENPHVVALGLGVGSVLQQEGYCLGMTFFAGIDEGCHFVLTNELNL